jgi:amino acid transporter
VIAIICVSVLAAGLGATLRFDKLADVSNVAVVVQYISTCIAILVWRTRDPGGSRFQLPLGPTIPIVAILGSVLFLFHVSRLELFFGGALLVVGLAIGSATRFFRRQAK